MRSKKIKQQQMFGSALLECLHFFLLFRYKKLYSFTADVLQRKKNMEVSFIYEKR